MDETKFQPDVVKSKSTQYRDLEYGERLERLGQKSEEVGNFPAIEKWLADRAGENPSEEGMEELIARELPRNQGELERRMESAGEGTDEEQMRRTIAKEYIAERRSLYGPKLVQDIPGLLASALEWVNNNEFLRGKDVPDIYKIAGKFEVPHIPSSEAASFSIGVREASEKVVREGIGKALQEGSFKAVVYLLQLVERRLGQETSELRDAMDQKKDLIEKYGQTLAQKKKGYEIIELEKAKLEKLRKADLKYWEALSAAQALTGDGGTVVELSDFIPNIDEQIRAVAKKEVEKFEAKGK